MNTENTDKNSVEHWFSEGNMFMMQGKHQEALAAFAKAIEIDPINVSAWKNKGNTLYNLNRIEESLTCYETTLRINPNDEDAL